MPFLNHTDSKNDTRSPIEEVRLRLDRAEEQVAYNFVLQDDAVRLLEEAIGDARAQGVDLSIIPSLEARVAWLKTKAAQGAVDASLKRLKEIVNTEDMDWRRAAEFWCAYTFSRFERHQAELPEEERKRIGCELEDIRRQLFRDLPPGPK